MIDVPFTVSPPFEEPPNTWKRVTVDGQPDQALYTCPNGHTGLLDHEIAVDGTVSPSVVCTECDFHDFIRLLDW